MQRNLERFSVERAKFVEGSLICLARFGCVLEVTSIESLPELHPCLEADMCWLELPREVLESLKSISKLVRVQVQTQRLGYCDTEVFVAVDYWDIQDLLLHGLFVHSLLDDKDT